MVKSGERYPPQVPTSMRRVMNLILRKLKFCTDEEGIILKPEDPMLDPKGAPHYIENVGNEEAGSSRF